MPARRRKTRRKTSGISKADAAKLRSAISSLATEASRMMKRIKAAKKKAGRK